MKSRFFRTVLPAALVVVLAAGLVTEFRAEEQIKTKWGNFAISLRYRLESVSDDDPKYTDDALASTLRTTVLYRTPTWNHLSAFVQFEDVSDIGAANQHNNGQNGVTTRPGIPDAPVTEVNQAALRITAVPRTTIDIGRVEINLGTQRYVGAVAWRQNHQSFDTFRVVNRPTDKIELTYAFLGKVHRVFGDTLDMNSHLLDLKFGLGGAGTLTPYVYVLDYDEPAYYGLSTTTYGARWQGKFKLGGEWSLPYLAEYAKQQDGGNNPHDVSADYYRLEVGGKLPKVWFKVGYELLGGSAEDGRFLTPLATLHKFNGWADKFLVTPEAGLSDLYVAAGGKIGKVSLVGAFHDFSSDADSLSYGKEFDLQALYKAPWKQVFAFKLASYSADDHAFDTLKAWVWTSYSF